jgi:hypothetical protein
MKPVDPTVADTLPSTGAEEGATHQVGRARAVADRRPARESARDALARGDRADAMRMAGQGVIFGATSAAAAALVRSLILPRRT